MSEHAAESHGTVRLFPLAGVVLFPHAFLPLHIFEQRYRQMTEDALADDRAIAMVLPKPLGTLEKKLVQTGMQPPLHPIGCVGEIQHEARLPDGRFTFILHGRRRFRIVEELEAGRMYRSARVEFLSDRMLADAAARRHLQRCEILELIRDVVPRSDPNVQQMLSFLSDRCPDDVFAHALAYAAPIAPAEKQLLLELDVVDEKLERLIDCLRVGRVDGVDPTAAAFPPSFSVN